MSHRKASEIVAACMLGIVSLLGLLGLFGTASVTGTHTPLLALDIIVYLILLGLAYLVYRGMAAAKIIYAILAILWYIALIFILPARFDHRLDAFVVYMQIIITILAFCILYASNPKKSP